jgi:hypothetical protein
LNTIFTQESTFFEGHLNNFCVFKNPVLDASIEKRFVPSRELLRYWMLQYPGHELVRSSAPGIPFRPVRRLGSEFLGKRSGGGGGRRSLIGSEFLGKRAKEFLPNRSPLDLFSKRGGIGSEFLGKRGADDAGSKERPQDFVGAGNYADVDAE